MTRAVWVNLIETAPFVTGALWVNLIETLTALIMTVSEVSEGRSQRDSANHEQGSEGKSHRDCPNQEQGSEGKSQRLP